MMMMRMMMYCISAPSLDIFGTGRPASAKAPGERKGYSWMAESGASGGPGRGRAMSNILWTSGSEVFSAILFCGRSITLPRNSSKFTLRMWGAASSRT
eukprot:9496577-Pyramimonas_sp.AAC.1